MHESKVMRCVNGMAGGFRQADEKRETSSAQFGFASPCFPDSGSKIK